jgi:hypothetical protein
VVGAQQGVHVSGGRDCRSRAAATWRRSRGVGRRGRGAPVARRRRGLAAAGLRGVGHRGGAVAAACAQGGTWHGSRWRRARRSAGRHAGRCYSLRGRD